MHALSCIKALRQAPNHTSEKFAPSNGKYVVKITLTVVNCITTSFLSKAKPRCMTIKYTEIIIWPKVAGWGDLGINSRADTVLSLYNQEAQ